MSPAPAPVSLRAGAGAGAGGGGGGGSALRLPGALVNGRDAGSRGGGDRAGPAPVDPPVQRPPQARRVAAILAGLAAVLPAGRPSSSIRPVPRRVPRPGGLALRRPGAPVAALRCAVAGAVLAVGAGAAASASACSLALALALDVSSSVDPTEYGLQADGLASALEDPDVKEAILAPGGLVTIAVYEWSGRWQHEVVAGWTALNTPAEIDALAARIRGFGRSHADYPTALGHAIGFAARLLKEAPVCDRRVLDISGDGANNDGYEPLHAYRNFELQDVTVNALVVGGIARPQLRRYFETTVIKGPGAFVEVARDYRDYARAMKRKLLREIRPPMAIGLLMRDGPG
ncbi:MAG: hypothetical protein CML43_15600 [Rhodobacteraceae bacterium]|nr:hypothetical protein [Paracoccaceae bacterium]